MGQTGAAWILALTPLQLHAPSTIGCYICGAHRRIAQTKANPPKFDVPSDIHMPHVRATKRPSLIQSRCTSEVSLTRTLAITRLSHIREDLQSALRSRVSCIAKHPEHVVQKAALLIAITHGSWCVAVGNFQLPSGRQKQSSNIVAYNVRSSSCTASASQQKATV